MCDDDDVLLIFLIYNEWVLLSARIFWAATVANVLTDTTLSPVDATNYFSDCVIAP